MNETKNKADFAGIDRILATDEEIVPSSGFFAATMERVREEAAAPPPIPFPWARAIPGILLVAAMLALGGWELARYTAAGARQFTIAAPAFTPANGRMLEQAGWVALALIVSYASWMLSVRLMRRSSLL